MDAADVDAARADFAGRGTQRPGHDVGEPERKDAVDAREPPNRGTAVGDLIAEKYSLGYLTTLLVPPNFGYYPDEYGAYGDAFRVIVLNVRGHTVVIYIDSARLPADQFTAFLDQATLILASLRVGSG